MVNVGTAKAYLELDSSRFNSGLKSASGELKGFENKTATTGQSIQAVGKTMGTVGGAMTKGLTLPLVGLGVASIHTAGNFEQGMSKVKALSGATGGDMELLEAKAREMGATTAYSATEASEAMSYMALAGWDASQMAEGLGPALYLAGAGGMDLAIATDIVTDTMSMFGLKAEDATKMTDMLAYAQANSNTDVEQLGEALKYTGASANAMGYDIADTSALLGVFADQGLKGSSAGTTLNAMFTDMKKESKDGAIAIGDTSVAIVDAQGNYRDMADIMTDVEVATKDMTQADKDFALSQIFGTQAIKGVNMVLEAGTGKLKSFEEGIRSSDGSAKDMYETMQDNVKGAFANFQSALEEIGIVIGTALIPMVKSVTEWLTALAGKFSGLDEGTQGTIIKFGLLLASIGPVLLVGSKLIALGGTLATAFGTVSGAVTLLGGGAIVATPAMTALAGVFTLLTGPIGLAVAGFVAVGLAIAGVVKHMKKEAIPAVDLYGKEVSKGTKKAVDGYLDLEKKASHSLKTLSWSGKEVTKEMVTDIVGKYGAMKDSIVSTLNKQKTEALQVTQELVNESGLLTNKQKETMVKATTESYDKQIEKTEKGQARIKDIMQKAHDGKMSMAEAEKRITTIQEQMQKDAVRILSDSEVEQKIIMERLASQKEIISTKSASDVIKASKKAKDGTIKEAEEEYNKRMKVAYQLQAEGGATAQESARLIIREATNQRDGVVREAEEQHKGVIKEAKAQGGEHMKLVDEETGEIMTKWQKHKGDIQAWWKSHNNISKEEAKANRDEVVGKVKEATEGIVTWWNDGKQKSIKEWKETTTEASKNWKEVKESVTKPVGEAVIKAKESWEESKAQAVTIWTNTKTDASLKWGEIKKTVVDKVVEIVNDIKKWFDESRKKINDTWIQVRDNTLKTWREIRKTVVDAVLGVYNSIKDKFTEAYNFIMTTWNNTKSFTISVWNNLVSFMKTTLLNMYNNINEKFKAILTWITTTWNNVKSFTNDTWTYLTNFLRQTALKIYTDIKDRFEAIRKWIFDTWNKVKVETSSIWNNLKTFMWNTLTTMYNNVRNKFTEIKTRIFNTWDSIKTQTGIIWEGLKKTVSDKIGDMIQKVKDMPGKMAEGIRNGGTAFKKAFESIWITAVRAVGIPANKIIGGANFILGKFGVSKDKQVKPWIHGYAKGTAGHPGGPAMVNDAPGSIYKELVETPDGEAFIPEGRNTIIPDLPKGSKVMKATDTAKLMRYKDGVGLWESAKFVGAKIKDTAIDVLGGLANPVEMVRKVIDKYVSYAGAGVAVDMGKGLVSKVTQPLIDMVKGMVLPDTGNDAGLQYTGPMGGGIGFPGLRKTSPFGWRVHPISGTRRMHSGVDMAGGRGTGHPIGAQSAGVVNHAGRMGGYGIAVKTRIGAYEHLYAHLSRALVSVGQVVQAGRIIGLMGSTGNSTGPHVHYEKRLNGRAIHPGFANGGWITKNQTIEVAEGDKPEMVLPLTKPARALELIRQAKQYMGVKDYTKYNASDTMSLSASGRDGGVNITIENMYVRKESDIDSIAQRLGTLAHSKRRGM